jgi:serine/threonine-protein kinase
VVHRDVKPGNLLVSDSDVVKLADFGIARAVDQSSITQVGSVLGTAAYLAPEQARGEEAGPRADLYSLGVVTYQLLSGRLPYEATSLSELTLKQQRELPAPLDEVNPRVPHELALAVGMALSIDQEARPPDAMVLAESLRNGANGIAPVGSGSPTASLGTNASTRVLAGYEEPTASTRIEAAPRPPRTGQTRAVRPLEPRRVVRPPQLTDGHAYDATERRAGGRAFRRLIGVLAVLLLFVAAVVVAVVIATSTSPTVVHFKTVVGKDAQSAISSLQNIINQYTK